MDAFETAGQNVELGFHFLGEHVRVEQAGNSAAC